MILDGPERHARAKAWYLEGCPRGWAGPVWMVRAWLAETIFLLAMRVAPETYRASWRTKHHS